MISKQNAKHYNWKEVCDGWHLVSSERLSVIQETMPPHTAEDIHRHDRALQFFFMLAGQATMKFEDRLITLAPMEGVEVEAGVWHQMCNESDSDIEFLVVSSPKAHGDRQVKE